MLPDTISIEAFTPSHLDDALALSRQAGWPHRAEDWATALSLSRGVVALAGDRVVGTALMTPYGAHCATVNLVLVEAAMRGRGLGRRLTNAVVALAGDRECRLVATDEGQPLYESLGFRAEHGIVQHQGLARPVAFEPGVAWAAHADLPRLVALDREAFGADRGALFAAVAPESRFAVIPGAAGPQGFAVLRPFGRGEVIGPVVAADRRDALALITFLVAGRPGSFLRIDTPDTADLSDDLIRLGLVPVGGGTAMRRNAPRSPETSRVRTFALASQALG